MLTDELTIRQGGSSTAGTGPRPLPGPVPDEELGRLAMRTRSKPLTRALVRLDAATIMAENKATLQDYARELITIGLQDSYVARNVLIMLRCAELLDVPFRELDKGTALLVIQQLESPNYKPTTRITYRVLIRKFFTWLNDGTTPECIAWLKPQSHIKDRKLPEELLTVEDIQAIIAAADNPRDKAFIATLYDSGCRIGELLGLAIKHIQSDGYGAVLLVDGKTGQRRVRIMAAVPYLSAWIAQHPLSTNPEAPVWITIRRHGQKQISYHCMYERIREIAQRAGLTKRVHPHLFRHSRATELAQHLTDQQLKLFFGWTADSHQTATYVHLADIDAAMLAIYGIEQESQREEQLQVPTECARCSQANPAGARVCNRCGAALDLLTVLEADEEQERTQEFLADPRVQALWARIYGRDETLVRGGTLHVKSS